MNSLDTKTGNIGFGTLASTKWPEVSGQIKTVFTTKHPTKEGLVTVFVVVSQSTNYIEFNLIIKLKYSSEH